MHIQTFFEEDTATACYVVSDDQGRAAIIDSVLEFEAASAVITTRFADMLIEYVRRRKLRVEWILETHVHADHLSAAWYIKEQIGGKIGIGEHIREVLHYWVPLFRAEDETPLDGSQFDHLFADGERFQIGSLEVEALHTPGHTPACVSYRIEDAVFVGDTIFMPYVGTARTDFPGGDAGSLYDSIRTRILALPDTTRIFTGHDYPPAGQAPAWQSTVAEQRRTNLLLADGVERSEYIARRNERDRGKAAPRLLLPSLQVNLRAGRLPRAAGNGQRYLQIPLRGAWAAAQNADGSSAEMQSARARSRR
ncbi:MAG: MBL fold metallo-hydrolase [Leptospirales bacterium]|nr:MBL fold metallo-hydrolase [Leptospirales bacterium]